jgi:aspartate kinase
LKVFKFGGASVKNADSIRNMASIIKTHLDEPLVVIVSAMGKMTNAFERLLLHVMREEAYDEVLLEIKDFHQEIIVDLGMSHQEELHTDLSAIYESLSHALDKMSTSMGYDYIYDQSVSNGELLSTKIISAYLNQEGINNSWLDARKVIKTDSTHRKARVDWGASQAMIKSQVHQLIEQGIVISQGFIGSNADYNTTTLGREGSDFSGAIFATSLDAKSLTIWKDVDGVLNADPKKFKDTALYPKLPYKEAAEMTYYGASVIHPKTIKPLAQKGIPLYVRSFENPDSTGTLIQECIIPNLAPAIIHKESQTVISFKISDFSFINESHIHLIFDHIKRLNLNINLMQNSAITFTICMDDDSSKREQLMSSLQDEFLIYYNEGLEMITVKNFNQNTVDELMKGREIIIEQRSRNNFQMIYKPL